MKQKELEQLEEKGEHHKVVHHVHFKIKPDVKARHEKMAEAKGISLAQFYIQLGEWRCNVEEKIVTKKNAKYMTAEELGFKDDHECNMAIRRAQAKREDIYELKPTGT